jgi:hypothetical protein
VAADTAVHIENPLRLEALFFQVHEEGVYFPWSLLKALFEVANKQLRVFFKKLFRPVCHKISPELSKELSLPPLEMAPFGEHQFLFVEKKFAFFGYINHVSSDEELQGILPVVTSSEHPLEYGLRLQFQIFNGHGIFFADGILLPERFDYLRDGAHYHPVGQEDDR